MPPFDQPINDASQNLNKETSNQPAMLWAGDVSDDAMTILRAQPFAADGLHPMTLVDGGKGNGQPISMQAVFNDPRLQLAYLFQQAQNSYTFGNASSQVPVLDKGIVPPPPVPGDVTAPSKDTVSPADAVNSNPPLPSDRNSGNAVINGNQTDGSSQNIDANGNPVNNGNGKANSGGGDGSNNGNGRNNGNGGNNGGNRNGQGGGNNFLRSLLGLGTGIGLISLLASRGGGLGGGSAMGGLMAFSVVGLLIRGLTGGGNGGGYGGGYGGGGPLNNGFGGYNMANNGFSPFGLGNLARF